MQFDLEKSAEIIKNNQEFLKLKEAVENNKGHDHESVYDHCVASYERIGNLLTGSNITNSKAREKFERFLNQKIGGISKNDLIYLAALLHDVGKLKSLETNPDGTTVSPEHGKLGSAIVPEIVKDLKISQPAIDYLSEIVKLHLGILPVYPYTAEEFAKFLKTNAQGLHPEILLVMYADLYNHPDFQNQKAKIIEVLNTPEFYQN